MIEPMMLKWLMTNGTKRSNMVFAGVIPRPRLAFVRAETRRSRAFRQVFHNFEWFPTPIAMQGNNAVSLGDLRFLRYLTVKRAARVRSMPLFRRFTHFCHTFGRLAVIGMKPANVFLATFCVQVGWIIIRRVHVLMVNVVFWRNRPDNGGVNVAVQFAGTRREIGSGIRFVGITEIPPTAKPLVFTLTVFINKSLRGFMNVFHAIHYNTPDAIRYIVGMIRDDSSWSMGMAK
jgi:hypothetical protein